jgi:SagB-type dehydrogenase family enzyme
MPFRAAACTGALYHIELYLVCGDLPGLNAGVYHFDPSKSTLRPLRKGDYRRTLIDAAANEPAVANAPAVLVYTDIFSRNSVKYQAREYRHAFWDSGTIIANTLATAAASSLPANVVIGFVDDSVNQLLSLDDRREVALALIPIGYVPEVVTGATPEIGPLEVTTVHGSDFEVDFPAIQEMHQASSLASWAEVAAWRAKPFITKTAEPSAPLIPLEHQTPGTLPMDPVEKVITRRGSTREFSQDPISFSELSTILEAASHKLPADFLTSQGGALADLYLIINEVDGVRSGSYAYGRNDHTLELIRKGEFRHDAGQLALGQTLGADASVNLYFMARLEPIVERLGNRGYRAAQLEASITAGRIYLAAYALGLGATGLTFRDDDVTGFLSPHAKDKSAMFLVAVGKKVRRR